MYRGNRSARLGSYPCSGMRRGEDPAQVLPPFRLLDQQRDVAAVGEVHLRPVDRPQAERAGGLSELHRAGDGVVVGQRHRLVAELRSRGRQLVRQRGAVQEREG